MEYGQSLLAKNRFVILRYRFQDLNEPMKICSACVVRPGSFIEPVADFLAQISELKPSTLKSTSGCRWYRGCTAHIWSLGLINSGSSSGRILLTKSGRAFH